MKPTLQVLQAEHITGIELRDRAVSELRRSGLSLSALEWRRAGFNNQAGDKPMTRFYFTTSVERTKQILERGFEDMYEEFGRIGVWFADAQLDINDGFSGDVTLTGDSRGCLFPIRSG